MDGACWREAGVSLMSARNLDRDSGLLLGFWEFGFER